MTTADAKVSHAIQIYLDESGDEVSYALAGLVGAEENWKGFADDWSTCMGKYGLKGVALHMRELQKSPNEPWASLRSDPSRVNALLNDLVDIIIAHRLALFGACLLLDEYKALDAETKRRWPNPYKLCFETTMGAVDETCDPGPDGTIHMTFDQGCNEGWAKQAYAKLKAKAPSKAFADEAAFESDDAVVALSAADLIAYELRRAFYNFYIHKKNELRPAFQKLVLGTRHVWWKVNFENVIEGDKVVPFLGSKDAVSEIFLYADDLKP